jgi:hypothetical protein
MLNTIANTISRFICLHRGSQLRRVEGSVLYIECMECGACSPGVVTGE